MITFETIIFTVITFVLVAVILAGYVSVLKKNGWIGKTSFEKDFKTSSVRSQPEFKAQNAFGSFIEVKEPKPKEEGKEPQNQKDKTCSMQALFWLPLNSSKDGSNPRRVLLLCQAVRMLQRNEKLKILF